MTRRYYSGKLQQLESGKWRFMLPPSVTGKPKWSGPYETRELAEQALNAALYLAAKGELEPDVGLSLGRYGERWLASCQHRSVEDDRQRWRRFIASRPIAEMGLDQIKPGHVKRLIESVSRTRKQVPTKGTLHAHRTTNETVSGQTVRHVYGLLKRCLREAIVDGHISVNPCNGYRLPHNVEKARTARPADFLSKDEIEQVLSSSLPLRSRLIYEVAIFTGLRAGELWGLRWQDIELDGPRPACRACHSFEGPTKNRKVRTFLLLPRARAALLRWRSLSRATAPGDLVFPGRGGRMHAEGYDAGWSQHKLELGLRRQLTFHALRHTFASHLAMGTWGRRWQLHEISEYIGHSSIGVTQRYAHLSHEHLAELVAGTAPALPSTTSDETGRQQ